MKTVLLASPNPPDCPQSPITNNRKTSKGETKMSDQETQNPVPPEQKPAIQPNQPVQQKPVVPIAQPKVPQSEREKCDQPQKKHA